MADESVSIPHDRHLKDKVSDEFKRFFVIFLYLWVVFGLLSIHKSIILSQNHLDYPEHAFVFINAFIFAKILLIGEYLHLGTRFRDKPNQETLVGRKKDQAPWMNAGRIERHF